jgi:hypothetical protein
VRVVCIYFTPESMFCSVAFGRMVGFPRYLLESGGSLSDRGGFAEVSVSAYAADCF